jgi:asparagine synthase (glutamine-hydrolysing)
MTALAGYWSFDGERAADACARMLKSQAVYGPDGDAQWDGPNFSLGRRLHRILPEDAYDRRPVAGAGGRLMLVADLRLDNRRELASDLGLAGGETERLADSALLMRTIERWGEAALTRLLGDFALALWDAGAGRLLLARDAMGARPLHFHRGEGFFAFASMPKGLHALPRVPYRVDKSGVADFLAQLPESGAGTFFEGIEKVAPGELVEISPTGLRSRIYWQPVLEPLRFADPQDYAEGLRERLDAAVAARLRGAEGRVAAHLSGGLDSSAVAVTAARLLAPEGGKVVAFTAAPREGYEGGLRDSIADESPQAAAAAALYPNIEHVVIRSGGRSPLQGLDRNFFLYERPIPNLCNAVWSDAINDSARERRLKVLLTGQGGNRSFSWSGMTALPALLGRGRLLRFASLSARLVRGGTRVGTVASQSLGPFLPTPLWKAVSRLRGISRGLGAASVLNPEMAQRIGIGARAAERGADLDYRPRRDGVATRLWAMGRADIGAWNKGTLAGWGLDSRDPTADRRLFEYCLRIPDEAYLAGGMPRGLARLAFADRLPREIVGERRKGYQAADWHDGIAAARAEVAGEIGRIAATPEAAEAIDGAGLRWLLEHFPSEGWNEIGKMRRYRGALLRGLSAGHFLRKASGANE